MNVNEVAMLNEETRFYFYDLCHLSNYVTLNHPIRFRFPELLNTCFTSESIDCICLCDRTIRFFDSEVMDSIKAAAKALRNSPRALRKKIVPTADGHSST